MSIAHVNVIVKREGRNAREHIRRIHLRYNTKTPPYNALSATKATRGRRKVSVTGQTL